MHHSSLRAGENLGGAAAEPLGNFPLLPIYFRPGKVWKNFSAGDYSLTTNACERERERERRNAHIPASIKVVECATAKTTKERSSSSSTDRRLLSSYPINFKQPPGIRHTRSPSCPHLFPLFLSQTPCQEFHLTGESVTRSSISSRAK